MALARIHPQSRVIYVTHSSKGALAERVLRVESTDVEAGWHHLFGDAEKLPAAARRMLEGAHSIYSFVAEEGDAWTQGVRAIAPEAEVWCLRPRPAEGEGVHSTEHLLSQLAGRKAVHGAVEQMLRGIRERGVAQPKAVAKRVVVHPGSGSAGKCWPVAHFVELCGRLRADGDDVRVILGEVEMERWGEAQRGAFADVATVRRPATYVELLGELLECERFVGNDSGPGHLAAAVGVRTFVLFGPTDPAVWRPVGPRVFVMRHEPLEGLGVEGVHEWMRGDGTADERG